MGSKWEQPESRRERSPPILRRKARTALNAPMTVLPSNDTQSSIGRVARAVRFITAENDSGMYLVSAALDELYRINGAVMPAFCLPLRWRIAGEFFARVSN